MEEIKQRRQLTEEEKALNQKSIDRGKDNLKMLDFRIKYQDLMLSEGLEMNYINKRREMEQEKKEFEEEKKVQLEIVDLLQKQIDEGVEIKEVEEETEEEESDEIPKYIK
jgi:hypothetical protein